MNFLGKTYLIKNHNMYLSVTHLDRTYLVGFNDIKLVNVIAASLPQNPALQLKRHNWDNVGLDVQKGLVALKVPIEKVPSSIIVDPEAELTFPKIQATDPLDSLDFAYDVEEVSGEDFLMYPFKRNLGVISPYEIARYTSKEYVCNCNLVESSGVYKFD
jgi:hypothetical protein